MTLRKTKPVILVALPDVIISDLKVVRRRFPQIAVIAISGEYNGPTPAGLIADAFLTKGAYPPEQLFEKIAGLIEQSPIRPSIKTDRAPVWVPKSETGYFVVTRTECLRSTPFPTIMPRASFTKPSAFSAMLRCAF